MFLFVAAPVNFLLLLFIALPFIGSRRRTFSGRQFWLNVFVGILFIVCYKLIEFGGVQQLLVADLLDNTHFKTLVKALPFFLIKLLVSWNVPGFNEKIMEKYTGWTDSTNTGFEGYVDLGLADQIHLVALVVFLVLSFLALRKERSFFYWLRTNPATAPVCLHGLIFGILIILLSLKNARMDYLLAVFPFVYLALLICLPAKLLRVAVVILVLTGIGGLIQAFQAGGGSYQAAKYRTFCPGYVDICVTDDCLSEIDEVTLMIKEAGSSRAQAKAIETMLKKAIDLHEGDFSRSRQHCDKLADPQLNELCQDLAVRAYSESITDTNEFFQACRKIEDGSSSTSCYKIAGMRWGRNGSVPPPEAPDDFLKVYYAGLGAKAANEDLNAIERTCNRVAEQGRSWCLAGALLHNATRSDPDNYAEAIKICRSTEDRIAALSCLLNLPSWLDRVFDDKALSQCLAGQDRQMSIHCLAGLEGYYYYDHKLKPGQRCKLLARPNDVALCEQLTADRTLIIPPFAEAK